MSTKQSLQTVEHYLGAQLEHECKGIKPQGDIQSAGVEQPAPAAPAQTTLLKTGVQAEQAPVTATDQPRPIKRILVAVDHERHPALVLALNLASALHGQVAVVHALEPLTGPDKDGVLYPEEVAITNRRIAEGLVKSIEQEIPPQARAFTCLREGLAATEIISAAQEWQADLIIMGTHRRGVVARLFLGSTSQAVLRHAPCPILLVADVPAQTDAASGVCSNCGCCQQPSNQELAAGKPA